MTITLAENSKVIGSVEQNSRVKASMDLLPKTPDRSEDEDEEAIAGIGEDEDDEFVADTSGVPCHVGDFRGRFNGSLLPGWGC